MKIYFLAWSALSGLLGGVCPLAHGPSYDAGVESAVHVSGAPGRVEGGVHTGGAPWRGDGGVVSSPGLCPPVEQQPGMTMLELQDVPPLT